MEKQEMLEAIATIQPYIDAIVADKQITFKEPKTELEIIEKLYNIITQRRYVKFCNTCGGVIREALILINNWRKRELKQQKNKHVEIVEPITEKPTENVEISELLEEIKPSNRAKRPKKQTNGRKSR